MAYSTPEEMATLRPWDTPQIGTIKTATEISARLRADEELIDAQKRCSWVAWHLPEYDTELGKEIAECLAPAPGLTDEIKRLIYDNILGRIRRYLKKDGPNAVRHAAMEQMNGVTRELLPEELSTTLKVLIYLQENYIIQQETPAESIIAWLQERVLPGPEETSRIPKPPPIARRRLCYICRLEITRPYPSHPALCIPCGAFNHASSELSLPPRLTLPRNFTVLVTGARVNLGYHTVLRLLRCGASVIGTTRYPRDAISRYYRERDVLHWRDRLRIVGADFRSAKDAHALVHLTKQCLKKWMGGGEARLYALINNAAQTLTDSVKKEERAVQREEELRFSRHIESHTSLIHGGYTARIRGGALPLTLESGETTSTSSPETPDNALWPVEQTNVSKGTTTEMEPYSKSSWVQGMSEIPYEDVGSALSVNTFVPFILCRELLPIMGTTGTLPPGTASKPQGYIINVSSREGIFEDHTTSSAKAGKHVHTNMSKAALNMLTETEAEPAWRRRKVAMNTVDPGYMSAAPEYEDAYDGKRPIGWEDGAGRVLWPIAVAELEGQVIRGRFLKHYGAVEVEPGMGRG